MKLISEINIPEFLKKEKNLEMILSKELYLSSLKTRSLEIQLIEKTVSNSNFYEGFSYYCNQEGVNYKIEEQDGKMILLMNATKEQKDNITKGLCESYKNAVKDFKSNEPLETNYINHKRIESLKDFEENTKDDFIDMDGDGVDDREDMDPTRKDIKSLHDMQEKFIEKKKFSSNDIEL